MVIRDMEFVNYVSESGYQLETDSQNFRFELEVLNLQASRSVYIDKPIGVMDTYIASISPMVVVLVAMNRHSV